MTVQTKPPDRLGPPAGAHEPTGGNNTRSKPVTTWAFAGALIVGLQLFVLLRWVTGPYFKRVHSGPTHLPEAMKVGLTAVIVLGFVLVPIMVYRYVIVPWRRERRLTSDALMLIWFGTLAWFYDPFANFFTPYFTYNSWLFNMGSWIADIPGFHSIAAGHPGKQWSYPLMFALGYIWAIFGFAQVFAWLMRRIKARYPRIGTLGILGACFVIAIAVFTVLEVIWLHLGMYSYEAAIPSLTLWYGHFYQLPIYEPVLVACYMTGYAALLYFRNDKGQLLVERGIDRVRVNSKPAKTGLRFLAIAAACTGVFMFTYNVPYWFINMYNPTWPADVQQRSYLTNFICGPDTNQACPSSDLPLSNRDTIHFDPQGRLIVPSGDKQPGAGAVTTFKP